ncbi:coproporphyrinogen III oxidase [Anaerobacillus alkalilacustris]|uniref:Heme chaperone HemW n=1 Tax=Anaerobacillus alkalilacustris TaxID=393763 RepID=A0A1S2LWX3_9BACI|nr:radical SAM family heme chaperone HemW [Anaerobacillus alkalilacustris]OIJ16680.1 coproporphyrinogen III oxidase [Anaerobacillus alkalilacustris]
MFSPKAVYVHIPFCEQICHYCDFNKVFLKGQPVDDYIAACETEMKETVKQFPYKEIQSIYVGGGTPTSLSVIQLERLLKAINNVYKPCEDVEYTIEVNPSNMVEEKLAVIREAGINRLSIGVQAFQEELLRRIGRNHVEKDIYDTIDKARTLGFENISIDLMFGLPGQTVSMFKETLIKAIQLNIPHFSAYSLKVEEKTVFHQLQRKGKLHLPAEDEEVEMYELLMNVLLEHGYDQYEISNFSKSNYESKHNLTYWNNEEYYGIGAGAHGYVGGVRHSNVGPIKKYISLIEAMGRSANEQHFVTTEEKIEEEMFLGLRKLEGVSIERFVNKYGKSPFDFFGKEIKQLQTQGLVEIVNGQVRLTRNGLFVANEVFEKFLF